MNLKTIIKKYAYIFIRKYSKKQIKKQNNVDILFLHMAPERINRTEKMASSLKEKGMIVEHKVMDSFYDMFFKRLFFCREGELQDRKYPYLEAYANYLVELYNPKIIITFNESTIFNLYLKKSLNEKGGKIINFAHGIVSKEVVLNNDKYYFDYYFVFGESSLINARNKKTHGDTKIVKVGSFFMDYQEKPPISSNSKKVLFCSQGDKIDKKVNEINLRNVDILCDWANQNDYEVLFKFHPLEDESIVKSRFKDRTTKFTYLPKNMTMYDAVKESYFVIMSSSNSSLEVALLGRPIVLVNHSKNEVDGINTELEKYYLKSASNSYELDQNVRETLDKIDFFIDRGEEYVSNHIEVRMKSTDYITKCIMSIFEGKEEFDYVLKKDSFLGNNL